MRALLALGVVLTSFAGWAAWRRAPKVRRIDLRDLGTTGPAIVQFTTPFCGPCKRNVPSLQAVSTEADVPFVQVDLAERPELARRYGIRTVPTIVVTGPDGAVLGTWTALPANGEIKHVALSAATG